MSQEEEERIELDDFQIKSFNKSNFKQKVVAQKYLGEYDLGEEAQTVTIYGKNRGDSYGYKELTMEEVESLYQYLKLKSETIFAKQTFSEDSNKENLIKNFCISIVIASCGARCLSGRIYVNRQVLKQDARIPISEEDFQRIVLEVHHHGGIRVPKTAVKAHMRQSYYVYPDMSTNIDRVITECTHCKNTQTRAKKRDHKDLDDSNNSNNNNHSMSSDEDITSSSPLSDSDVHSKKKIKLDKNQKSKIVQSTPTQKSAQVIVKQSYSSSPSSPSSPPLKSIPFEPTPISIALSNFPSVENYQICIPECRQMCRPWVFNRKLVKFKTLWGPVSISHLENLEICFQDQVVTFTDSSKRFEEVFIQNGHSKSVQHIFASEFFVYSLFIKSVNEKEGIDISIASTRKSKTLGKNLTFIDLQEIDVEEEYNNSPIRELSCFTVPFHLLFS